MRTFLITASAFCAAAFIAGCVDEDPGLLYGGCVPEIGGEDYCDTDFCPTRCGEGRVVSSSCHYDADEHTYLCACTCCAPFGNVAGQWAELYTCIDETGACFGQPNTAVEIELMQSSSRIDWEIVMGVDEGSEYGGELCRYEFEWESKPGTADEQGCWTFSDDGQRFNKISHGSGFRCVGSGSAGADSTPESTPTCAQIDAANLNYNECPPKPPASPID